MTDGLLDDLGGEGDFVETVAFPAPRQRDQRAGRRARGGPGLAAAADRRSRSRRSSRPRPPKRWRRPTSPARRPAPTSPSSSPPAGPTRTTTCCRRSSRRATARIGSARPRCSPTSSSSTPPASRPPPTSSATWCASSSAHPDQLRKVRDDRSLIPNAVEEVLRFDPPVQLDGRYVFEDIEIDGVTIEKGSSIITLLAGANRDPDVCPDPETLRRRRATTSS